jgi:hypothetical protein
MFEHLQSNYDAHIATAASIFKRAFFNHKLECNEESRIEFEKACEHLFWLIAAKREGWNPSDFKSEWEN